jgi:hypothetical protein
MTEAQSLRDIVEPYYEALTLGERATENQAIIRLTAVKL